VQIRVSHYFSNSISRVPCLGFCSNEPGTALATLNKEFCLMSTNKPAIPPKSELAGTDTLDRGNTNAKLQALEAFRSDATGQALRTNQGVKISDNQNTLKVGARGPSLLEDFIMREKSPILITNVSPSALYMRGDRVRTVSLKSPTPFRNLQRLNFLQKKGKRLLSSYAFPPYKGDAVQPIWHGI